MSGGPYRVDIIDGNDSWCEKRLEQHLNELLTLGYEVRFITPNGVNRWTVVSEKEKAITLGLGATRILHGAEVVVEKPVQEG